MFALNFSFWINVVFLKKKSLLALRCYGILIILYGLQCVHTKEKPSVVQLPNTFLVSLFHQKYFSFPKSYDTFSITVESILIQIYKIKIYIKKLQKAFSTFFRCCCCCLLLESLQTQSDKVRRQEWWFLENKKIPIKYKVKVQMYLMFCNRCNIYFLYDIYFFMYLH